MFGGKKKNMFDGAEKVEDLPQARREENRDCGEEGKIEV
jgi:hypothetical protein